MTVRSSQDVSLGQAVIHMGVSAAITHLLVPALNIAGLAAVVIGSDFCTGVVGEVMDSAAGEGARKPAPYQILKACVVVLVHVLCAQKISALWGVMASRGTFALAAMGALIGTTFIVGFIRTVAN